MRPELTKTISFAVLHFAVGFTVSYAFTGSIAIAGGIAIVEPLANTVVFYFHERGWNRFGATPPLDAQTSEPSWHAARTRAA